MAQYHDFPCGVCGSDEAEIIEVTGQYQGGKPLHVCKNCGFVYVRSRRSAADIAKDWSDELYGSHYTAYQPYVKARQTFVAEILKVEIGLEGKLLCDIGAGEGRFLEMCRSDEYGADVFGIEPSDSNCELMTDKGIDCFSGTIEDFVASGHFQKGQFDVVTIMWTLENCEDPKRMLNAAYDSLKDGGYLQLSTSSRIMVPIRKPLHYYLTDSVALDTHAFRFSANTQRGILAECGFKTVHENRFIDHDVLTMIGQKTDRSEKIEWAGDDYREVLAFFERWHDDTEKHWKSW